MSPGTPESSEVEVDKPLEDLRRTSTIYDGECCFYSSSLLGTSDTFMDLPGYLENIEHSIKNSFTLKSNEIDDVLIKIIKFGLISNQTTFLATQKSNLSQIILLKSDFISKKAISFKNIDLCFLSSDSYG